MNDLYQKYIEVKDQISKLQATEKVLAEQVMQKMNDEKIEKLEADNGLITMAKRKSWIYSDNVNKANDSLKELKKKEEKDGTAKEEVKEYLRVTLR